MKHRKQFHLIATTCRRCGKPLMTGSRSLWGAENARAKFAEICSDCITPEDRAEMEQAVNAAVLTKVTAGK